MTNFSIPDEELFRRQQALRQALQARNLAGAVFFQPVNMLYLANYAHLSTERPIALVVPLDGEVAILLPKLEEQHLHLQAPWLEHVHVYAEFPGEKHPLLHLADLLAGLGLANSPLGADHDGHLDQNGYFGPSLSTVLGREIQPAGELVTGLRRVKSELELELLPRQRGMGRAHTPLFTASHARR